MVQREMADGERMKDKHADKRADVQNSGDGGTRDGAVSGQQTETDFGQREGTALGKQDEANSGLREGTAVEMNGGAASGAENGADAPDPERAGSSRPPARGRRFCRARPAG